ncbi:hypothetical protein BST61_g6270 [Cercospora zeina]
MYLAFAMAISAIPYVGACGGYGESCSYSAPDCCAISGARTSCSPLLQNGIPTGQAYCVVGYSMAVGHYCDPGFQCHDSKWNCVNNQCQPW